jgi:rRNA-processing protein FCF1
VTVVLDTSALMMPVECDIRLFDELDRLLAEPSCVVPRPVETELEGLANGTGREATAAGVGLDLLDRCETRATAATYADDAVVELARTDEATHAVTNDGPLQNRLLERGVSVIGLRGKNKLATTQP